MTLAKFDRIFMRLVEKIPPEEAVMEIRKTLEKFPILTPVSAACMVAAEKKVMDFTECMEL